MPKKTQPAKAAAKTRIAKPAAKVRKAAKPSAAATVPVPAVVEPLFKAMTLQQAATDGEVLHLTVADDTGRQQQLQLSSSVQHQLLKALLGPPIEAAGVPSRAVRLMTAQNFRLFQDAEGITGIEIVVGARTALHIRLPGLLPDALETLMRKSRAAEAAAQPQQTH